MGGLRGRRHRQDRRSGRKLDLRLEQSCDHNPPLHAKIHIDKGGLPAGSPMGALESVSLLPGGVKVDGWALDPETVDPVSVEISVDGAPLGITADVDRPDIAATYPFYGAAHGFSETIACPFPAPIRCA